MPPRMNDVFEADPVGDGEDDLVAVIDEDRDRLRGRAFAGGEDGFVDPVCGSRSRRAWRFYDGLAHVGTLDTAGCVASEVGSMAARARS